MKVSAIVAATLIAASPAAAWTFVWRDATNHVADGTGNRACTKISHKAGKSFEWDRPAFFNSCCIRLYTRSDCGGDPAGLSCRDWNHVSSVNLNSFKVNGC